MSSEDIKKVIEAIIDLADCDECEYRSKCRETSGIYCQECMLRCIVEDLYGEES